ncbi:MAG: glycine cleavage system protein GcvH [Actinobacteria bacterium]|nr:glycine cleavage system protein GcvH [Actinomycetota bacterium]
MHPEDLLYSEEHEWVRVEGEVAVIGITYFAQSQLGEVVYVDLPSQDTVVAVSDVFGEVESVKSVSELFSPVSGTVIEVNSTLQDEPEIINVDPYDGGWLVKVALSDSSELDGLMSAEAYNLFIKQDLA